jgi:hypothetical protein
MMDDDVMIDLPLLEHGAAHVKSLVERSEVEREIWPLMWLWRNMK